MLILGFFSWKLAFHSKLKKRLDPRHLTTFNFQTCSNVENSIINQWETEFYERILLRKKQLRRSWLSWAFPKEKTIYGVNVMGAIRKLFSYWFSLKWEENGFLSPRRSLNTLLYAGRCNLKVVTWKMNCQFILHPFAIIPVQHHKKCPSHSG